MLSNPSTQHNKQNATCLGAVLTADPSEPETHPSVTSDWQATEVSGPTRFAGEALHPQPLWCQEDRTEGAGDMEGASSGFPFFVP